MIKWNNWGPPSGGSWPSKEELKNARFRYLWRKAFDVGFLFACFAFCICWLIWFAAADGFTQWFLYILK